MKTESSIVKEGMIKLSEENEDEILFAEGESGENWNAVSLLRIEDVEFIHEIFRGNQMHLFVRLHLKESEEGDALFQISDDVIHLLQMLRTGIRKIIGERKNFFFGSHLHNRTTIIKHQSKN